MFKCLFDVVFLSLRLQITDYSFVGDRCVDVDFELTIYILYIIYI